MSTPDLPGWVTRYTARGHAYREPVIVMPRIPDHYLDCVVYLYKDRYSADQGERIGGSGFLLRWQDPNDLSHQQIYVVTNWHVVFEGGNYAVRLNTQDGKHDVIETDERLWQRHTDGDDLAVYPIDIDEMYFKYKCISSFVLLSRDTVDAYNIGPGDEVFSIGRFINHEGKQRNLPCARFGTIAQMPWEPLLQPRDNEPAFPQESFLIEVHSISGYSGSPVVMEIPTVGPARPGMKVRTGNWGPQFSHGPWLVGVSWGYLKGEELPVWLHGKPGEKPSKTLYYVESNSGLMGVVPAWKLEGLLKDKEVERRRNLSMKRRDEQARDAGGVSTSARPSETAVPAEPAKDDANPNHKEAFTSLLNAASKKSQPAG